MVIVTKFRVPLFLILLVLAGYPAYTQRVETQFIEHLTWEPVAFAYYYEVVVERLDDSGAVEVVREVTEESFLDCALSPGHYRYLVRVYNLMGRPELASEWAFFEILPALPKGAYNEEKTTEGDRFMQRLTWDSVAFASYYEAVVEQQQDDSDQHYREVLRKVTEKESEPLIICFLPPGHYRFQVMVYNLFGRLGARSEWAYFEVLPIPEVLVSETPLPEPEVPKIALPEPVTPSDPIPEEPVQAPREPPIPRIITHEPAEKKPPAFMPLITARAGMMVFYPGPEGHLGDGLELLNRYDPIGSIALSQNLTNILGFNLNFDRDALLINRLFVRATLDWRFIGLEVGPSFGLFNLNIATISPALSMIVKLTIPPGIVSGLFRLDTSLGRQPNNPGDYTQDYREIRVGLLLPFFLLTLSMSGRDLIEKKDQYDISSSWIRYNLSAEFHKKDFPFAFRLDVGYQQLKWIYTVAQPVDYTYGDVYVGLEVSYRIWSRVKLFLGVEVPVFPWVYPYIQSFSDPQVPLFYGATLGFLWNLGAP
ncbi:MAG: hypothetical protein LBT14_09990 [Treponema sp.]|jgi:hypothetical protein|nr:hypothetical protein [Treponema sp.]